MNGFPCIKLILAVYAVGMICFSWWLGGMTTKLDRLDSENKRLSRQFNLFIPEIHQDKCGECHHRKR